MLSTKLPVTSHQKTEQSIYREGGLKWPGTLRNVFLHRTEEQELKKARQEGVLRDVVNMNEGAVKATLQSQLWARADRRGAGRTHSPATSGVKMPLAELKVRTVWGFSFPHCKAVLTWPRVTSTLHLNTHTQFNNFCTTALFHHPEILNKHYIIETAKAFPDSFLHSNICAHSSNYEASLVLARSLLLALNGIAWRFVRHSL